VERQVVWQWGLQAQEMRPRRKMPTMVKMIMTARRAGRREECGEVMVIVDWRWGGRWSW